MDAKFGFDDNADFRQKDIFKLRDITQEDPQEVEAAEVCPPSSDPISPSDLPEQSRSNDGLRLLCDGVLTPTVRP